KDREPLLPVGRWTFDVRRSTFKTAITAGPPLPCIAFAVRSRSRQTSGVHARILANSATVTSAFRGGRLCLFALGGVVGRRGRHFEYLQRLQLAAEHLDIGP